MNEQQPVVLTPLHAKSRDQRMTSWRCQLGPNVWNAGTVNPKTLEVSYVGAVIESLIVSYKYDDQQIRAWLKLR